MLPELLRRPPLVRLPASIRAAGFALDDHRAVVSALGALQLEGAPKGAVLKRRAEFLAGRWAALQALSALGFESAPGRNADGTPSWPELVVGSITHGAARALCAAGLRSEFRSLGIDAEQLLSEDARAELRDRICSPAERGALAEGLKLADHVHVSLAFSAKESLFKCLYPLVGRFMDFAAARVVELEASAVGAGKSGSLTLELTCDWSEAFRTGQRLHAEFLVASQHVETAVLLSA